MVLQMNGLWYLCLPYFHTQEICRLPLLFPQRVFPRMKYTVEYSILSPRPNKALHTSFIRYTVRRYILGILF